MGRQVRAPLSTEKLTVMLRKLKVDSLWTAEEEAKVIKGEKNLW